MNKNSCEKTALKKGAMDVYDFGGVRLHAYRTNDAIDDEVFFFEKEGKAVALESPCFFDNYEELTGYFAQRNISVEAMLVSYHMAGGTFLPGVRKYATRNAVEYGTSGGGKALADGFTQAFGAAFDGKAHEVTDVIPEGKITLCGIGFVISLTQDAFDVEIPEIHAVYTHMLGHDCHSIVAGAAHADAMIAVFIFDRNEKTLPGIRRRKLSGNDSRIFLWQLNGNSFRYAGPSGNKKPAKCFL